MNFSEQVAEAKIMHWGMYCGICDTCTKEALCSIACPNGGVDDGQTYGENGRMSEERIELLKKALALYGYSVELRNEYDERNEFFCMVEELSKIVGTDLHS